MDARKCSWFRCGTTFEPGRETQHYCGEKCRKSHWSWKMLRGGQLIDVILHGDAQEIIDARRALIKEMEDGSK